MANQKREMLGKSLDVITIADSIHDIEKMRMAANQTLYLVKLGILLKSNLELIYIELFTSSLAVTPLLRAIQNFHPFESMKFNLILTENDFLVYQLAGTPLLPSRRRVTVLEKGRGLRKPNQS